VPRRVPGERRPLNRPTRTAALSKAANIRVGNCQVLLPESVMAVGSASRPGLVGLPPSLSGSWTSAVHLLTTKATRQCPGERTSHGGAQGSNGRWRHGVPSSLRAPRGRLPSGKAGAWTDGGCRSSLRGNHYSLCTTPPKSFGSFGPEYWQPWTWPTSSSIDSIDDVRPI